MKLPDVNVLLYAVNIASAHHVAAKAMLRNAFLKDQVGLAWASMLGFLRLSTRKGILPMPLDVGSALDVMHSWLNQPAAVIVEPTARHAAILGRLLVGAGRGGNLVTDAHLAALAIEHDAELLSFDRDFEQFAGLRWSQPG